MERSQGYVGNLQQKTLPELQELLDRQEKILVKPKFLESLPDKGEKVKIFAQTLHQLISERQDSGISSQDSGRMSPSSASGVCQLQPTLYAKEKHSDFAKLRDHSNPSMLVVDTQESVLDALSQPRGRFTEDTEESFLTEDSSQRQDATEVLSERLQGMVMSDTPNGKTTPRLGREVQGGEAGGEVMFPNSYEIVMRSNAENKGRRPLFKPNSTLKVSSVKDLPEQFKPKAKVEDEETAVPGSQFVKTSDQRGAGAEKIGSQLTTHEESAVRPHVYHFASAKLISVEDSIELQRQQRQHLEKVQAEHAAERLAERLHIKMDDENTIPFMDMNYRTSGDVDSDDDPDPDDSV